MMDQQDGQSNMVSEEMFHSENIRLQEKIQNEIDKVKDGRSNKSVIQLFEILNELIIITNKTQQPISFPHFIVDSWEYDDVLGTELLELAELYKKLN